MYYFGHIIIAVLVSISLFVTGMLVVTLGIYADSHRGPLSTGVQSWWRLVDAALPLPPWKLCAY